MPPQFLFGESEQLAFVTSVGGGFFTLVLLCVPQHRYEDGVGRRRDGPAVWRWWLLCLSTMGSRLQVAWGQLRLVTHMAHLDYTGRICTTYLSRTPSDCVIE